MSEKVTVTTIGFTQTTAQNFFERLRQAGVSKLIDVRLNNTSQLAGFAKSDDLGYFLDTICNIKYIHTPFLAPTGSMLKEYKKEKGDWKIFENKFLSLLKERKIEDRFKAEALDGACFLCSEAQPHHCHRRILCEYLNKKWNNRLIIKHI